MTMTTTQTMTNQDRIAEALDRINARRDDATRLLTLRTEMNNGVVLWRLDTDTASVSLNLTRSDAEMADLLDVIAVLTEGDN